MSVYIYNYKNVFLLLSYRILPSSVHDWSEDHVHYFLKKNNLTSFNTVFENFNGHLLYRSYLLCEKNEESMFQALRQEVSSTSKSSILTLGTYLSFLEALKQYIPTDANTISQPKATTTICNIL